MMSEPLSTNSQSPSTFTFWISGSVTPKVPGPHANQAIHSWLGTAKVQLQEPIKKLQETLQCDLPLEVAEVKITFVGTHQGDLAWLINSISDLLIGLLKQRINFEANPRLEILHELQNDTDTGIKIEIKPLVYKKTVTVMVNHLEVNRHRTQS